MEMHQVCTRRALRWSTLVPQRHRQQRLGQPDQRKGRNLPDLVALAPKQGMEV